MLFNHQSMLASLITQEVCLLLSSHFPISIKEMVCNFTYDQLSNSTFRNWWSTKFLDTFLTPAYCLFQTLGFLTSFNLGIRQVFKITSLSLLQDLRAECARSLMGGAQGLLSVVGKVIQVCFFDPKKLVLASLHICMTCFRLNGQLILL